MKRIFATMAAGIIAVGLPLAISAQDAKDEIKDAGRSTKHAAKATGKAVADGTEDAAKATGHAAKKTGRAVKHGTKKVVHGAASATESGADKVREKTATP